MADEVFEFAMQLLARGSIDPRSPLRWPVLSTVNIHEEPEARMVVLRGFDRARGILTVYTDVRSGKVRDLAANPAAEFVFFSRPHMLQIRVKAHKLPAIDDAAVNAHWSAVPAKARADYRSASAPGTMLSDDTPAFGPDTPAHFHVLQFAATRYDVLKLAGGAHQRVIVTKDGDEWTTRAVQP